MHEIDLKSGLLEPNSELAKENRDVLAMCGTYAVNLMSGPGAGKTSLLERLVPALARHLRVAVIEGDIVGSADAERIERLGVPVQQINTGGACHLDARMVHHAIHHVVRDGIDLLLIENVGNLVCPAEFDLGEDDAVMLLSVAEGHDKPKKYPLMFRRADLIVVSKVDLLGFTNFDYNEAVAAARDVHPGVDILPVSCRTGEGVARAVEWIERRVRAKTAGHHHVRAAV
ncbi:MAG: hydrogenase nickel incorporation protein HypB [Gemmatimonadota bacterium]|jgi:hydrogenase nickel incorporation protein HypB